MAGRFGELAPPQRILLGPGPSDVHPRVLRALSAPVLGYLDPAWFTIMDETQELLRLVFETENEVTFPVSATGMAGMETCLSNLVEAGDEILVCSHGFFGQRIAELADRLGATVRTVETEWGRATDPARVEQALKDGTPKVVAAVHGETSTGVLADSLADLAELAHSAGALFLVDCVTTLGGVSVGIDENGIDAAYSGSQKCLGAPCGLSPVTFSARAMEAIQARKTPASVWYFDVRLLSKYWGGDRAYHHTPPINNIYGLREALRMIDEERLAARFARHLTNHEALAAGLEAMGISLLPPEGERLPSLNAVRIPEGVDDARTRKKLLDWFGIEIGGGFGSLKGKIWRVGLMGHSSQKNNVLLFLGALEHVLTSEDCAVPEGAGVAAASAKYAEAAHE